jgi:hypothetical protein
MVTTDCRFVNVDFTYYKAELLCFTGFWGKYSKPPSYSRLNLPKGQNLMVEHNVHSSSVFEDGDMAVATTVVIPLGDDDYKKGVGAPDMNPRTNLSWNILFSAHTNFTAEDNATEQTAAVPYAVELTLPNIPMYQMYNVSCEWLNASSAIRITGKVALDETCLDMLQVMQGVMWMLAGATFTATVWWMLHPVSQCGEKAVKYDLLAFSAAMLFALPQVRGLWPAAPPGGTVADVMHIYAQLLLISFAILLQIAKFLYAECSLCKVCSQCSDASTSDASTSDDSSRLPVLPTSSPPSAVLGNDANGHGLTPKPAALDSSSSSVRLRVASWPLGQQSAAVGAQAVVRHSSMTARRA